MLKYVNVEVVFSEIPDEITLAINISNCPNNCEGCHSSYLQQNIGFVLNNRKLLDMIIGNKGITVVCFMGGDISPIEINKRAEFIKEEFPNMKVGWYSGKDKISDNINLNNFDFIKIGPYIKDKGPLNNKNTNQKLFKVIHKGDSNKLEDITYKFWNS